MWPPFCVGDSSGLRDSPAGRRVAVEQQQQQQHHGSVSVRCWQEQAGWQAVMLCVFVVWLCVRAAVGVSKCTIMLVW
jgi:hypothetical protein